MAPLPDDELVAAIKSRAGEIGFSLIGIAPASRPDTFEQLRAWVAAGKQGTMQYIPRRLEAYADPGKVLDGVRTVIVAAMNYGPGRHDPESLGRIAAYAQGTVDYHHLLRERLKSLADCLHEHRPVCRTRVVVDSAPILERDFARRAGLGWFGKNTMLINKRIGSFFFLGALLTDCDLPEDAPHVASHCGTCSRCLDACPTGAFDAPYLLDARKCISYLTIELRNAPIPEEFHTAMGDWMFGCDVCQIVCPWNRHAPPATEPGLAPEDPSFADASLFVSLTESEFRARFGETPLSRPGWAGMARNAVIAAGNSSNPRADAVLAAALNHPDETVRDAARRSASMRETRGLATGSPNPGQVKS